MLKEKQRILQSWPQKMGMMSNPRSAFGAYHITIKAGVSHWDCFLSAGKFYLGTMKLVHQVNNVSLICNALNFMVKSVMIFLI